MKESFLTVAWFATSLFVVGACADPRCPGGYIKKGDTCYRIKDAGSDASGDAPEMDEIDAGSDASSNAESGSEESADDAATFERSENACDSEPCENGGKCSALDEGFSCDCEGTGYEGPKCATDRDECANLNTCNSAAYPCVQVAPAGYTCKGQFADWRMPDALAGAKHAPAYDIRTASLVRDTVTGLTWQRALGENPAGYTWLEAKLYCDQLELAGERGWRLPSKIELESIVDETMRPASDGLIFSGAGSVLWSGSPVVGESDHRWLVDFLDGSSAYFFVDVSARLDVRCVRGPADAAWSGLSASRYTVDTANDTISDNRTSLVWERTLSTGNHTWEGAKQYCAELGQGWRLPAYKELLTLVDPTRINPSIDPLFPDTPAVSFWTASPSFRTDGTPDWPRRIDFATGASDFSASTAANRVRCVK